MFHVAIATVSAAVWIAAILVLQAAREASRSATIVLADRLYAVLWLAKIGFIITALFQTAIFWSLAQLIPDQTTLLLKILAAWSLFVIAFAKIFIILESNFARRANATVVAYLNRSNNPRMIATAFKVLVLGYLTTLVFPNPLAIAIFVLLCVYFGLGISYNTAFALLVS